MRIPLRWLREYVSSDWPAEFIADRLTMAGLEVSSVEHIGATWDGVQVALVTDVKPHPNADRLRLVTVTLGDDSPTVVCGAPNVAAGQKIAFAGVGARLFDGHSGTLMTLKAAKIRGIVSAGMVCSEKELGLSDNHEGILELSPDAPVGLPLREHLGDAIFSLDLTPNRPDCLAVIGVAREVAALCGVPLQVAAVAYPTDIIPASQLITVSIEDSDDCHRYCATVIRGVRPGPSPEWLQSRLKACGLRPISNIVDVTNYVMLEYGQPLHAFDYDRVARREIHVRRARPDEKFQTLDGIDRQLNPEVLVIADGESAVGIAGIMGGSNTEVSDQTSTVLLEAANFGHAVIRRGSAFLGLRTEASLRFDKGLPPELAYSAIRRATQLLVELCGGTAAAGVSDTYPVEFPLRQICLPPNEVLRLTGVDISRSEILSTLDLLGFQAISSEQADMVFDVPYWRRDVTGPADLVEEVVRINGYDKIPVGSPRFTTAAVSVPADLWEFKTRLRRLMAGSGFQEMLTYSLVSKEELAQLTPDLTLTTIPLSVDNPMSKDMECLRTSLRASLLGSLAFNRRRELTSARLFELSRVYLPQGTELPDEREILCAVLSGTVEPITWHHGERTIDFFDAKGIVELLLRHCGIEATFKASHDPGLFPGRQAAVQAGDDVIGVFGQLHPSVAHLFEVDSNTLIIELDVSCLMRHSQLLADYEPLSRFPSSERDLALVVDESVDYASVHDIIMSFGLVGEAALFDLYRGEQLPAGKKSFAVRLTFRAPDRTLTDAEVQAVLDKILVRLKERLGAVLRG